ncbi:hypothetical protein BpHYR1_033889 [Brachionus plicatilis]|uniref:Uncharacterized protein n=1 Tax=Brachionus plicatilis TaxID=10195 RepID=A0A3M7S632_BRAPC|nr:hypothetical protein BpHYR1_033889 [Brachionus plicatilis]
MLKIELNFDLLIFYNFNLTLEFVHLFINSSILKIISIRAHIKYVLLIFSMKMCTGFCFYNQMCLVY